MSNNRKNVNDGQDFFSRWVGGSGGYIVIPSRIFKDNRLREVDIVILARIAAYCNNQEECCFASNGRLAADMSRSESTVKRSIRVLNEFGYLRIRNYYSGTAIIRREIRVIPNPIPETDENIQLESIRTPESEAGSAERLGAGVKSDPGKAEIRGQNSDSAGVNVDPVIYNNTINNKRRGKQQLTIKKPTIHEAINLLSDIKPEYVRKAYEYWESVGWVRKNGYKVDHYIAAVRKSAEAEARFIASKQPSYEESKPLPKLPPRSES